MPQSNVMAKQTRALSCHAIEVVLSVGAAVGDAVVGAFVSPALVGAAVPLDMHTGRADMNAAPIGCALKDTAVVDAEHQRGTVAEFIAAPHVRLSAAPAARHSASEPM
jgi:hypothetical protein